MTAESEPTGNGNVNGSPTKTPSPTATSQPTESQYQYQESGVGLTDQHFEETEYGNLVAAGIATNLTDSILSYVQITVAFVNATGAQLETSLDNTTDLAAGQQWRFSAMYPGMDTSEVDSAYTTGIDAY